MSDDDHNVAERLARNPTGAWFADHIAAGATGKPAGARLVVDDTFARRTSRTRSTSAPTWSCAA